jgi:hypothetical protein
MSDPDHLIITCKHCGKEIVFDQPYPYHAGFADQGFLYNEAGTLTLVWSIFDPAFNELFPNQTAWALSPLKRRRFEKMLLPAPDGGCWRFKNPARCLYCGKGISKPMLRSIHYLVYPGSILTDQDQQFRLTEYFKAAANTGST